MRMQSGSSSALRAAVLTLLVPGFAPACGDAQDDGQAEEGTGDGDECSVAVPTGWSAPAWDDNAAEALAVRAQLDVLVSETMRAAEEGTATVDDIADLQEPFEGGVPSLATLTTTAYRPIVDDAFQEFVELVAAGQQDLIDDEGTWSPGEHGGIFGEGMRGLNEGGLEVRQIVDKGLFGGGALYNYALTLTAGDIEPGTVDALAAAWGANASLDPAGELTDSANYSQQMGFHAEIGGALIAAKAYAADPMCDEQRDQALRDFFGAWELSMLARLVYYTNEALAATTLATSDTEIADALHELGEGLGLGLGFYGVPAPASGPMSSGARVITDADIEAIAAALGVDIADLGASTTGTLIESVPNFEAARDDVEAAVQDAFGLEPADIQEFRDPTPG